MIDGNASKMATNTIIENDPCPICLEPYTKSVRKEISCQYCHESTCVKCIEKYLLNTIEDPHCPHCRNAWSRSVLATFCTSTFLNQVYVKYRQTILLNREKSYLPQLQVLAEREKKARDLEKEDDQLARNMAQIVAEYNANVRRIMQERTLLARRIYNTRNNTNTEEGTGERAERTKFIRRCTAEGCKGFLSSVWKCGICSLWSCPECFEVKGADKDAEHTCKPDMLETARLLKKDTRPCPSCGEMIMKTEGCDQMFCTSCHKPFSWSSGKVITSGPIHNPHYFQWIARGGGTVHRNPGDVPCGGLPDAWYLRNLMSRARIDANITQQFMHVYRMCGHIIDVERTRYNQHLEAANNNDVGVRYMINEISEEMWMQTLAKRERERQKSNEFRDILDAFMGATIDIVRRIDYQAQTIPTNLTETIIGVIEELNALREFTNEALMGVSKAFNCSAFIITSDWEVKRGKHTALSARGEKKEKKKATKTAKKAVGGAGQATPVDDSDDSSSDEEG